MKMKTFLSLIRDGQFFLMLRLKKSYEEFYRACFISAGLEGGIYDRLRPGPVSFEKLNAEFGSEQDPKKLEAWLEVGVRLGELKCGPDGYILASRLSKKLAEPLYDSQRAFLEELVQLHHTLLTETPKRIKQDRMFTWADADGEMIARSSRVLEPLIRETMDQVVPGSGECALLEVGCGSGVYIRQACGRNSRLKAVGLEIQPEVGAFARKNIHDWQLDDRVTIEIGNILDFQTSRKFDLVTLHNNIYYFPENKQVDLARRLKTFLKPGGRLVITTGCRDGGIAMKVLNLWAVMTEGAGALPKPDELQTKLVQAGFQNIRVKNLMPGDRFYQFIAGV
jgi:4-hydroxy-2,2'-bipyrrole-5-carbaldehyde O-methyltransferase